MQRLTTRSIKTAQAIRDREPFRTSGSLHADKCSIGIPLTPPSRWAEHRLNMDEWERYVNDRESIDYIVWSFNTPIAWHVKGKGWYIVAQKFSPTTTKHQGNLYLCV